MVRHEPIKTLFSKKKEKLRFYNVLQSSMVQWGVGGGGC